MAIRNSKFQFRANIWPGFVDAMTALLLILFFVLSIFMIVQFTLRETILGQDRELSDLSTQLTDLAQTLGLERTKMQRLESDLAFSQTNLLSAQGQISDFESQIATLLVQRSKLQDQNTVLLSDVARLKDENTRHLSAQEQFELTLSMMRDEIDTQAQAARLAAAKREALEALIANLKTEQDEARTVLEQAEQDRLLEAAAAAALTEKLQNADMELSAMTLALEAERKRAEETLTLLAAAETAQEKLKQNLDSELDDKERTAALLAIANQALQDEKALSADGQRQIALFRQQTQALRAQLSQLQGLLDESATKDEATQVQIENLGQNLNAALARVAAEQRKRADVEAQNRKLLEKEANDLRQFRSEFFARLRDVLGEQEGVRIVGDRFVFASEVLFNTGSAELGARGQVEIANVAKIINQIRDQIPDTIDWVLRVDGHTDRTPIVSGLFTDNWDLSQARALSVVRFLIDTLDFPADRLSANGFGEFQPIDARDTPQAYAANRRIELKFTEK